MSDTKCEIVVYLNPPGTDGLKNLAAKHSFMLVDPRATGLLFHGPLKKAAGFCNALGAQAIRYEQSWGKDV